ncbi:CARDB domain-containing protein [Natrarchaeobaculum sulfurireducens]|uniref:Cell surface protein n=1 Tax=Natrarchaeobaculum sulfurireducens TaxID=2044521 RepID=A0A346PB19_9EURY|nr:CARDB domain-containing protein [Natrarchaeobaculum sulfurireducens]AXR76714.1 Cell surface protein [Natrarchaeobaculum sulfurireducens]
MKHLVPVLLIAILVVSLPAGVAGAAGGTVTDSSDHGVAPTGPTQATGGASDVPIRNHLGAPAASIGGSDDVLHRTTTLRQLPDRPGEFETEKTFDVPDPVVSLEIDLESRATVVGAEGFEETADGTYRWTEVVDEPSIRFTMPANRTGDVGHHAGGSAVGDGFGVSTFSHGGESAARGGDGYTFVETGEWGIVRVPGISVSLQQTSSVGVDETVRIDGPGATGGDLAFFGEVSEYERPVAGETIRLVVPEAAEADLAAAPETILETLAWGSERLDVGARSDDVFVVAVPADLEWGPQGVQYGDSDAWVVADSPLEHPANVWLHEYVHVRQGYTGDDVGTTSETQWLVEAQAEYYAATLAFEKGLIEFDEFSRFLAGGERSPYADAALADPDTWTDDRTDYVKGRLVYGELDRQLRLATDGDRTAEDVFRVLNAGEGTLTGEAYLELLEQAGGETVRSAAERYVRSDETPTMWSQADHAAAFDLQGATFEYGLDGDALAAGGESWPLTERDGHDGKTTAVPVDEPVSVPVRLDNVGDRDGTADATLEVDGRVVDYTQPHLEAGEEETANLTWTPDEPGEYTLRIGDETVTVFVRSDASVHVADLDLEPTEVRPDEPVTATATVENPDEVPAAAVLEFRTHEGGVGDHPVFLEPGETATITEELLFDADGEYEVVIGEQSATVVVQTTPPAELEQVPGFGLAAAVLALSVALVAARIDRARRR